MIDHTDHADPADPWTRSPLLTWTAVYTACREAETRAARDHRAITVWIRTHTKATIFGYGQANGHQTYPQSLYETMITVFVHDAADRPPADAERLITYQPGTCTAVLYPETGTDQYPCTLPVNHAGAHQDRTGRRRWN